jgi:N-carbamoyl-L-amino-acid hydrolase
MLCGQLPPDTAAGLTDGSGATLDAARLAAGCTGSLADVKLPPGRYDGFIELHIGQGPQLEHAGLAIGAVTAIAAPATLRVRFQGPGGHAGVVQMSHRADPLLAAAALAMEVEAAVLERGGRDTVGTVGVFDVRPRSVNSIPREVTVEIDVRDINGPRRDRVLQRISCMAQHYGERRRTPTTVEAINADAPAMCAPSLIDSIERASADAARPCQRLISRAYHDALFMSQVCPTSMVFIPCRGGVSQRPEECASPESIRGGVEVLARTLLALADKRSSPE